MAVISLNKRLVTDEPEIIDALRSASCYMVEMEGNECADNQDYQIEGFYFPKGNKKVVPRVKRVIGLGLVITSTND